MTAVAQSRRGIAGLAVFTTLMLALLIGLGVWQLQRRVEKHALIAALTERLAATPGALPPPAQWKMLTPARDEFRRVSFTATFEAKPHAMVYSSGSAIRSDISGPGKWVFAPVRTADGETVVVNRGFVADGQQSQTAPTEPDAPVQLTGYLRFPEQSGMLTPHEDRAKRLWFLRDQRSMADALAWGEVAPFYVDLEVPVPSSGVPKPGPLEVHLKDDHLQYAITWFGLAGAVLIAFAVWLRGQWRQ